MLLVGTKYDLYHGSVGEEFIKIPMEGIKKCFCTSAKNNIGISDLLDDLVDFSEGHEPSLLAQQIRKFKKTLQDLPQDKYDSITAELNGLSAALKKDQSYHNADTIINFTDKCHLILEGEHPIIMKALLALVAVVLVTLIASLVGFGIGFAAGAWIGPGAFITGFMSGNAAAVSVVSVAGIAGVYSAYGLFKESKVMTGLNELIDSMQAQAILNSSSL